jgi:phosphonate transport system permease protein
VSGSIAFDKGGVGGGLLDRDGPHLDREDLPSTRLKRNATLFAIAAIFYGLVAAYMDFNPLMLFTEFDHVVELAGEMAPPNLAMIWETPALFASTYSTVSMAFLGTLIGGSTAFVLAFFAAANVVPVPVVRQLTRLGMVLQRVTPTIIVLLVLQAIFGVGPFSGMISLAIGSFGMFGKLFADAIEQVDHGPLEAITCVGAGRSQMVRYGIIPEVTPSFIANLFYAFDINMRTAIGLGMFGGGGLGYELYKAGRTLNYKDQLALILVIVVMISLMERVSDTLRRRVIHSGKIG